MTVYADNAATTRMSRTALDAMLPCHGGELRQPLQPAQPSASAAAELLQKRPRDHGPVPELPSPGRSIFTSGGSEADNQALLSAAGHRRAARARSTSSPPPSSTTPFSTP